MASNSPQHPKVTANNAAKELIGQSSYSDVTPEPDFDVGFEENYHAIEVLSDGDVEIQTGDGSQVTLALVANRIYPIEIQKVVSGGTQVAQSDIWLYMR